MKESEIANLLDAPGALHHIIIRGIEGRVIFRDDEDRESFLDRIGGILIESSTVVEGPKEGDDRNLWGLEGSKGFAGLG